MLYLAQALLFKEYRLSQPSLWLLLDIQQAFDSLKRSRLLQYLLHGPSKLSREAAKLFQLIKAKLSMRWNSHEWILECNTGIRQGAPPSAGLFGLVLGECLDELFRKWDLEATVQTIHADAEGQPLHGWAFADDCILNFRAWKDFALAFRELLAALNELGLQVNLDKTVLVVHPDLWQQGVEFFAQYPDDPGCKIQWKHQGKYLGKIFSHYEGGQSLSHWLLSSARALSFAGWEVMAPVLKTCSWTQASTALQLLNKYVFAKWSWCAVILEPLQYVQDAVNTTQVTLLQLLLRVYIPPQLDDACALSLQRQRRRVIRVFLALHARQQWTYLAIKRKWSFSGHCLRRDMGSVEMSLVQAQEPARITQAKPAPWHSLYTFIATGLLQLGWISEGKPDIAVMRECASDRTRWSAAVDDLSMQYTLKLPYLGIQHWTSWKHPLWSAEAAHWYQAVMVICHEGSLMAVWLDHSMGCMVRCVDEGLRDFVPYLCMLKTCFSVEFILDPKWVDVILPQLPELTRRVWLDHQVVLAFSALPEEWRGEVLTFAGL